MATAAWFALPPALAAGVVVAVLVGAWPGAAAFSAVGAAAVWWAREAAPRRVLVALGGKDVDVATPADAGEARLVNLVEGLCVWTGVRPPLLRVVQAAGLNAAVAGSGPDRAVLAVTSSLLAELTRVELEAVLAAELMLLRRGEALPGTLAAAVPWARVTSWLRRGGEAAADHAAVSLTRYPPGLIAALEKLDAKGTEVPGLPGRLAHLWFADPLPPSGPAGASRGRLPLQERLEALREL